MYTVFSAYRTPAHLNASSSLQVSLSSDQPSMLPLNLHFACTVANVLLCAVSFYTLLSRHSGPHTCVAMVFTLNIYEIFTGT